MTTGGALGYHGGMGENAPLLLIELGLVLGGTLLWGWWELRTLRRERQKDEAEARERQQARKDEEVP